MSDSGESRAQAPRSEPARGPAQVLQCPICGADLWASDGEDRSGGAVRFCPGCGASLSREGGRVAAVAFEDKTLVCLPYELEQLARTEAVDGWYLVDTTASEAVPGTIEAHFRRAARAGAESPAVRPAEKPASSARPLEQERRSRRREPPGPVPRRPPPARAPVPAAGESDDAAPSPRGSSDAALPDVVKLVVVVLSIAAFVWVLENIGVVGVIVLLMFLPRLLRMLGLDSRRRR